MATHFLSANPAEHRTPRPTWQHSRDTSTNWGLAIASSTDPNFVAAGAIPWLLLRVVGAEAGPNGGTRLGASSYIQRVSTDGGVAPSSACAETSDVGRKTLVPYEATYVFFRPDVPEDD